MTLQLKKNKLDKRLKYIHARKKVSIIIYVATCSAVFISLYFHLERFGKIEHALPLRSIAFIFGPIMLHLLIGIALYLIYDTAAEKEQA